MLPSGVVATLVGAVHVGVGLCYFIEGLLPCYREMVCYSTPFKTTVTYRLIAFDLFCLELQPAYKVKV